MKAKTYTNRELYNACKKNGIAKLKDFIWACEKTKNCWFWKPQKSGTCYPYKEDFKLKVGKDFYTGNHYITNSSSYFYRHCSITFNGDFTTLTKVKKLLEKLEKYKEEAEKRKAKKTAKNREEIEKAVEVKNEIEKSA